MRKLNTVSYNFDKDKIKKDKKDKKDNWDENKNKDD